MKNNDNLEVRLTRKNFMYDRDRGNINISSEEARSNKHFSTYSDSKGRELLREDYDENGRLTLVTFTFYNQENEVTEQQFFSTSLKYYRKLINGIFTEFDNEGKEIRKLSQ